DQFVKFAGTYRTIIGPKATAACFCSFPAAHVSNLTCFFDQVAGTGLLLFFVVVIIDRRNGIPACAHPFLFGFVLVMIGKSLAAQSNIENDESPHEGLSYINKFVDSYGE
ncbi:hypothetical protein COOONC_16982, partial [Cooperia oncophora]